MSAMTPATDHTPPEATRGVEPAASARPVAATVYAPTANITTPTSSPNTRQAVEPSRGASTGRVTWTSQRSKAGREGGGG